MDYVFVGKWAFEGQELLEFIVWELGGAESGVIGNVLVCGVEEFDDLLFVGGLLGLSDFALSVAHFY